MKVDYLIHPVATRREHRAIGHRDHLAVVNLERQVAARQAVVRHSAQGALQHVDPEEVQASPLDPR